MRVPRVRFTMRRMMVAVAILPVGWVGGRQAWATCRRWDEYRQWAEYCSAKEVRLRAKASSDGIELKDDPELKEWLLGMAEVHRKAKEEFRHAMWRPWLTVEPPLFAP
jgi:hypothetical protein